MHPALQLSLLAHGIEATPQEVQDAVMEALDQHSAVLYPRGASALTAGEAAILGRGGFDTTARSLGRQDPLVWSVAEHAAIVQSSLTTAQVAGRLGVTEARIRQRLQKRSLYGFEGRTGWRVPSFQFTDKGELPGWSEVAPRLPADLAPVELLGWLTSPHTDLVAAPEDPPMTPRDWLLSGRAPSVVAGLAANLG